MKKPKIVVFCGSSKFVSIMSVAAWLVERDEQAIAMGLHLLPAWYKSPTGELPKHHLAEHEGVSDAMDSLHLRKIELADEVFVVNYDDYIGDSTRNEIAYATELGKPLRWFTHDPIGECVRAMIAENSDKQGEMFRLLTSARDVANIAADAFTLGGNKEQHAICHGEALGIEKAIAIVKSAEF